MPLLFIATAFRSGQARVLVADVAAAFDEAFYASLRADSALYSVVGTESFDGKVTQMGTYEIATTVELIGTFANAETGQSADPTTITLYLRDPDGNVTTFSTLPPLVKNSIGNYSYFVTPMISGKWTYKWQGVGTVIATSPDTFFIVNPSALIAG